MVLSVKGKSGEYIVILNCIRSLLRLTSEV
jgi:hypothetical protein